jgi:hypothetical protein
VGFSTVSKGDVPRKYPCDKKKNNNNSILYYLCAEANATRPIRDTAQCRYRYIMDRHNIKSKTNYRQALEEKIISTEM